MVLHANPVAKNCTAAERTGRIYRKDRHRISATADQSNQTVDDRALASTGSPGDSDAMRRLRRQKCLTQYGIRPGPTLLDKRDQAGQRAAVTGDDRGDEGRRHAARG